MSRGFVLRTACALLALEIFYFTFMLGAQASGHCSCTTEYDPVCGTDGVTYANDCLAECSTGKGNWATGRCPRDELNPVAGCVGTARCAGNPCDEPWNHQCQNRLPEDAVCFINSCTGVSYEGQLLPACTALWVDPSTKKPIRCGGPVADSCKCMKELKPVCGSDGITYANSCMAACRLGEDGSWRNGTCEGGCACPRDNAPVCGSDGVTYGNECLARCSLGDKGSWTDGECEPSCICIALYKPVCGSDGKTYSNDCFARCALGNNGSWTEGQCDLNPFAGCLGNVRCKRNTCQDACPAAAPGSVCFQVTCGGQQLSDGRPVDACSAVWVHPITREVVMCGSQEEDEEDLAPLPFCPTDGPIATCQVDPCALPLPNCTAASNVDATCQPVYCTNAILPDGTQVPPCSSVWTLPDGSLSVCPSNATGEATNCFCPRVDMPVCSTNNETFGNSCEAHCWGAEVAHEGECGGDDGHNCPRMCTQEINFVCGSDGVTYGNDCRARCSLGDKGSWTDGECEEPIFCTQEYSPVCGSDGKTYPNACVARHEKKVEVAYIGECGAGLGEGMCSDNETVACFADPCAFTSCPAYPEATCRANYCSERTLHGRTVKPCEAVFVNAEGVPVDCSGGDAAGSADALQGCPSDQVVACFADPCRVRSCASHPNATCIANYCQRAFYRGVALGPCGAVFVDTDGDPVECGDDHNSTSDLSFLECPANRTVNCLIEPCSRASCAANPSATCVSNYCSGAIYRNLTLGPCGTLFLDANGNPVTECMRQNQTPSCICPAHYLPVCGVDGKTYPNRCVAECVGVSVRKSGKCYWCKGDDECLHGKKNDICILGSRQCWAKKYECRRPAGANTSSYLGLCLMKPGLRSSKDDGDKGRHHHRRLLADSAEPLAGL